VDRFASRRSPVVSSRLFAFSLILSLVGSLAGCSGGSSSSSGGGSTSTTTPAITALSPTTLAAGVVASTLTISGSGFSKSSVVVIGGTSEATTYVSATQLTATVPATQLTSGAMLSVVVSNGSSNSPATNLEVDNPAPTIASTSMTTGIVGTASAVITFTGTGYVPSTVIYVSGAARATTFINSSQVSAALPSTDFSAAGSLPITAVNPAPGGGTSSPVTLVLNNPPVGLIKLSPSVLNVGSTSAATITATGTGFVPASVVTMGGTARTTTFVNGTTLTFLATVADQAAIADLPVTVTNPAPGGGTSRIATLSVAVPPATPVITAISPSSIIAGSPETSITITGTGFTTNSVVQWNGANLQTSYGYSSGPGTSYALSLFATVSASDLTATGTASITVNTPNASPAGSNAVTLTISNPPAPTLTGLYPAGGPINTANAETLTGTGFTTNTTVSLNGATIPSTFVSSTQITANFPAYALATPGNHDVTVTTPAPGGGTSAAQAYTTFVSIPNNDIVYSAADGLLYASVPASTTGAIGNAVVGIDPFTGSITRQIQVGTKPNKLALSTDGTQLFVGIDGASAVAQIDLAQGKIVNQFSLGGGPGVYNAPYTAAYMAALPGLPNSVAVATTGQYGNGAYVTIFDSGVARTGSSVNTGDGPLSFGSSASTLYLAASYIDALTVASTGITKSTQLASTSYSLTNLQYDNGSLYLSNGQVLNAATGVLNGTFYSSNNTQANGPIVSDSSLGRAFMAVSSYTNSGAIYIFDETSFNLLGTIPISDLGTSGYPTSVRKIVRWGQNGLAVSAIPSSFTSNNQIYIFQSSLVKDLSSAPADLSTSLTAPATATTGTAVSYTAKITNAGPNAATGAAFSATLDPSLIVNSITTTQGTCTTGTTFSCDLGGLANGASATVTVNATPTNAGMLAANASVSSSSYDPTLSNNQATASTTVTGSAYAAVPSLSSISPSFVQAGSADFTLTVNGSGFNSASTVNVGSTALVTTYVSSTQLTAAATAAVIANYGWAAVTVSNATPGGGVSSVVPLTIYDLVNVPANSILFDPYSQSLYATIASSATGITGNSVVAINPFTGTIGTPVPVGSQPTVMAESGDGKDLYISLSGAQSLAQFDLVNNKLLQTITFSGQPTSYSGTSAATALAVMPGTDTTLAVNFSGTDGIMDITGSVGKLRPNFGSDSFPTFGDATHLYTYDNYSTGAEFYRYSINANGLTLIDGTTLNGLGGFSGGFQSGNSFIYGDSGGIINPLTTPPSQIQTLPLVDFYGSGDTGSGVSVAADPSLQKEFIMQDNTAGTWAYGLVRYDLTSYLPEAALIMPAAASGVETTWTMLRFGQDGIALLSDDSWGQTPAIIQLLLVRGPFVAPQQLSTGSAASLTSSSAPSLTKGSGNTILTLTGSNFLPGVAVTWNGAYRTTTIADSTHVTVAIPASDLSASGTASIVATNPGAPASNTLQITVN